MPPVDRQAPPLPFGGHRPAPTIHPSGRARRGIDHPAKEMLKPLGARADPWYKGTSRP
jgi:hypothetical protein